MRAKSFFLVSLAALGLVYWGMAFGQEPKPERSVLYWYDPMYPGTRFDQPGRSPFMDMDLIPRYADEGELGQGVRIDPTQVQNLGLRATPVKTGRLAYARDLPANVEFNGYQRARLQSRAEGFVAQTFNISVGDPIKAGDTLAVITAPAWASDQSEYLLLKTQKASPRIIAGAREKLRLGGMPEEMLAEVDRTGAPNSNLRVISPVDGVVTQLDLYQGMNVDKNMTLAEIQGLDPIWVTAEVPEKDLALAEGRVRVSTVAWPGRAFEAINRRLLPQANKESRTVPLRLTVANPEGLLRPGLTAVIRLRGQGAAGLLIPTQALIDLGEEKRVITLASDGSFWPKLVEIGGSAREETLVTAGLEPTDTVVVSGLFLIDSEANLAGALDRLRPTMASPTHASHQPPSQIAPPTPATPVGPSQPTPTVSNPKLERRHDS
ncbi:MAG: efflux RND transporter periplasmic adaptor subunit [Deltaproteobacteria bacterium]|jgi:Cu(I)/Ag(I) efflux system membrane fusion protein|nr:efflux RND transporter periplasmic adaptor subunit [Deltaproteobacteria bacterium]